MASTAAAATASHPSHSSFVLALTYCRRSEGRLVCRTDGSPCYEQSTDQTYLLWCNEYYLGLMPMFNSKNAFQHDYLRLSTYFLDRKLSTDMKI
ncbi:Adenylosuccinate synthetase [Dirofilaria immitis]